MCGLLRLPVSRVGDFDGADETQRDIAGIDNGRFSQTRLYTAELVERHVFNAHKKFIYQQLERVCGIFPATCMG